MTIGEVASYLRCHESTLYRLIKRKQIPYFKLGSDYRFERAAIEAWVKRSDDGMDKS